MGCYPHHIHTEKCAPTTKDKQIGMGMVTASVPLKPPDERGNSSRNLIRNPVGLGSLWGSQVGMSIKMSSVVRSQNLANKNAASKHILSRALTG